MINPWRCPNCNERLIRKEGRYGPFMACPNYPDCQYTRALWTYQAAHIKPYCEKCKGEGMLPLTNKEGKIIPHARVYCECYEEEPEHFYPLQPEDIDFPISWDWHRHYCREFGLPDPGPCEPPEHSIEELHERVLVLEESPQPSYEPQLEAKQTHKPKPKPAEGVKL